MKVDESKLGSSIDYIGKANENLEVAINILSSAYRIADSIRRKIDDKSGNIKCKRWSFRSKNRFRRVGN